MLVIVFTVIVALCVPLLLIFFYSSKQKPFILKDGWYGRKTSQGTWNVRTLHKDYSLDVLMQELQHYNLDILGLQETRWTGKDEKIPEDDPTIHPFVIRVEEEVLEDLKKRLDNTRLAEPVENVQFRYGFNPTYLKEVVEYWKNDFNWREQEKLLNKYDHFVTQIEGIKVHYMHVKPEVGDLKVRVLPLMIIHGWPGSFVEFYKIIPLLTIHRPEDEFVFEIICPSIPGYGFSEAPHQSGFTSLSAARVFMKLMERIGHKTFYVQGGDWGSHIATNMAKFYPQRLLGLHINFFPFRLRPLDILKYLVIALFPSLVPPEEYSLSYPMRKKIKHLLLESGYFHLQCTKPDTLGCALSDSPAGLAAYLLEKFSVGVDINNLKLPDGGLTKTFSMDDLLTNVMIYWVTNSFPSSARFYRENVADVRSMRTERIDVEVPSAMAAFPKDALLYPRVLIQQQLKKLVSYKVMPQGGHFAAMEEPKLLADDIRRFVGIVEKRFTKESLN